MNNWKENVHFVLVGAAHQENIGASARAIKNMGFKNLRLVCPPPLGEEALRTAHQAEDVLEAACAFEGLKEAVWDCSLVVGATRRKGKRRGLFMGVEEGMRAVRGAARKNRAAVVFGREDRGLYNEEAEECGFMVSIPADPGHPSLNLSHAVMVVAYELSKAGGERPEAPVPAVTHGELDLLYARMLEAVRLLGFPSKGDRDAERNTMVHLKRVLGRASLARAELDMLHGICTQIERRLRRR